MKILKLSFVVFFKVDIETCSLLMVVVCYLVWLFVGLHSPHK